MSDESKDPVEGLLERASAGDAAAVSSLMPLVYDELRRLAGAYMAREGPGQTIQATALVHEAYLRLLGDKDPDWQGRTHFLAIAARSMRQILIERARARTAAKRGGSKNPIPLEEGAVGERDEPSLELLAIDAALRRFAEIDPRAAEVVELRYFGGLTIEEAAEALDVSPATVKRDWSVARAWLRREIRGLDGGGGDGTDDGGGDPGEGAGASSDDGDGGLDGGE